jgi:lipopolysaccharide transport system ATP-binding protein
MGELALEAEGLGKCYRVSHGTRGRLLDLVTLGRRRQVGEFWALRGVDLAIQAGCVLGVCGANGAGKSTLLRLLTGTTSPSEGRFRTRGQVRSLLDLGIGFRWELTGRENLRDHLALLGTAPRDRERFMDEIVDFSELGDFVDQQLRTYSAGMAMRLGFSVAAVLDPDVLILDEVFAVGDIAFQKKCIDRIHGFKTRGRTVVLCSHSIYDLRHFCDEALWLEGGRVAAYGDPVDVTGRYSSAARALNSKRAETNGAEASASGRGEGVPAPRITSLRVVRDGDDQEVGVFDTGDSLDLRIEWERPETYAGALNIGAGLVREDSIVAFGLATHFDLGQPLRGRGGVVRLRLPRLPLLAGRYTVAAYLLDESGCHRIDELVADQRLEVRASGREEGLFRPEHEWIVEERS